MNDYKRIADFARVKRGASPRPITDPKWFGEGVGWVRIGDVTRSSRFLRETEQHLSSLGETRSVRVEQGDLIMSICATIGKPIIVDMPACIHDGFVHLYDIQDVDVTYLYYVLQFTEDQLVAKGQPGTQVNLNTSIVGNHQVFMPSLPEQRKIARILSTVDDLIERTEALIAKYRAIKQGLMHDLLTRGVDASGRLRPPREEAPGLYRESAVGWVPKEWEVVRVRQAGSVQLGRQRAPKYQSGTLTTPYLRVANVFDGWIDYSDILSMDFSETEKETYSLLPGDILLNEGQSLELVGRSAIYEGEPNRYCFQNTLIRFRPSGDNLSRYCQAVLKYWLDIARFPSVARQTTSVAHLGAERFAGMLFPKPDKHEQLRISRILMGQGALVLSEQTRHHKLEKLKAGLMQDLLTGRVRVKV